MARYEATLVTDRPAAEVFEYLADLENFPEWDPGVVSAEHVQGPSSGLGAVHDVVVSTPRGGSLTMTYHTVVYDHPEKLTIEARTSRLASLDTITVVDNGDSTTLTYTAVLKLNGWMSVFDPFLSIAFRRIAGRAAAGLARELDARVDT